MSAYADLIERLQPTDDVCPFCGRDPYHYVDIGVGYQKAAVECCDLGIGLIQDQDKLLTREVALRAEAADAISRLEREKAELREVLQVADAAIAEMFRYFDGGEMRGSYDGKPERNQLRKAGYLTRQTLTRTQEIPQ